MELWWWPLVAKVITEFRRKNGKEERKPLRNNTNIKIDIFWKAVATVTAAVKEAPKRLRKQQNLWRKEVKQAASSVENSLQAWKVYRAQTFYDEGIRSVADFINWTEKVISYRNRPAAHQESERTRR